MSSLIGTGQQFMFYYREKRKNELFNRRPKVYSNKQSQMKYKTRKQSSK